MKKIILGILALITSLIPLKTLKANAEEDVNLDLFAHSAILIEPLSMKVIYEKNADEKLFPASMTKMMGMYLVLSSIENGDLKWTDMVSASSYACSMGGTQIFLEPFEQMSVEDLFKSVAINSANDAITALGEHISGSTQAFVKLMNTTAKEMGMNNTLFMNPTGFDDDKHVSSARDMSIVGAHLLKFGEDLFRFTSMKEAYVRENTDNPFWLVNTNRMLGAYNGMDGLKTGYTTKSGYNLTATAKRNGVRLLSVVMKENDIKSRCQDTTKLLDYGFSSFVCLEIFQPNVVLAHYTFKNSMSSNVGLVLHEIASVICKKNTTKDKMTSYIELDVIDAPIDINDRVGTLTIEVENQKFTFPIFVVQYVKKANFFDYFWYYIFKLLS